MRKFPIALALAATLAIAAAPVVQAARGGYVPPLISWIGLTGDIVGSMDPSNNANWDAPSGVTDAVFRLYVGRNGNNRIVGIDLVSNDGLHWDTDYGSPYWALGVTTPDSSTLLNDSAGEIDYPFYDRVLLDIHVEDSGSGSWFGQGRTFYVTVFFSDGKSRKGIIVR